jgi:hypothetical protein
LSAAAGPAPAHAATIVSAAMNALQQRIITPPC